MPTQDLIIFYYGGRESYNFKAGIGNDNGYPSLSLIG